MMPEHSAIEALLMHTLSRFSHLGVGTCVIFSGHFDDEQLAMIDRIAANCNAVGRLPRVIAASVNRCPEAGLPPDHAGIFETLFMQAIDPDQVDLAQLPALETSPDTFDRHDPVRPIWGVIGAAPRRADAIVASPLFEVLVRWLRRTAV